MDTERGIAPVLCYGTTTQPTTNAFLALSLREDAVLCTTQPRKTACSGAPMRWTPITPPLFTRYRRSPSSTTRGAPHDRVVEKSVAAPAINAAASIDLSGSPDGGGGVVFRFGRCCSCFCSCRPSSFVFVASLRCALAALNTSVAAGKHSPDDRNSSSGCDSDRALTLVAQQCADAAAVALWSFCARQELRASGM